MYQVAIIKADYEGWWLFDGWQDDIDKTYNFSTKETMITFYHELVQDMKSNFHSSIEGKYGMTAFYNVCDLEYCEDCDENLQIFYTPVMLKNEEILKS